MVELGHENEGAEVTRIVSFVVAVTLFANVSSLLAQEKRLAPYPTGVLSKVYSVDGRESLTISCGPKDPVLGLRNPMSVDEIDCKFVHVRINPPDKRVRFNDVPFTSLEEFIEGREKVSGTFFLSGWENGV